MSLFDDVMKNGVGPVSKNIFGPTLVTYHSAEVHAEVEVTWGIEDVSTQFDGKGRETQVHTVTVEFFPLADVPKPNLRGVVVKDGIYWAIRAITNKSEHFATLVLARDVEYDRSFRGRAQ